MGENRGRFVKGTCINDTWTKPKWVGSTVEGREGWGKGEWWDGMETAVLEQQLNNHVKM